MKLKIERPSWRIISHYELKGSDLTIDVSKADEWFDTHVEPINKMLSEGVELFGDVDSPYSKWRRDDGVGANTCTHKALLIDIQPIQKESAEDVLRDIINQLDSHGIKSMESFYDRAKRVLGDD